MDFETKQQHAKKLHSKFAKWKYLCEWSARACRRGSSIIGTSQLIKLVDVNLVQ
jgi:hypothetical protein